jgi:hypothetical protein
MGRDTSAQWRSKVKTPLIGFAELYKQLVSMFMKIKDMTSAQKADFFRDCNPEDRGFDEALEALAHEAWKGELATTVDPFYVGTLSAMLGRSFKIGEIDISYNAVPNENPSNIWLLSMMEFLSEQRFGRPLYQLIAEARKGIKESSESSDQLQRIIQDGHKLRYGESVVPTKGKIDHRIIFSFGLGLGLEELTCEELATFFDGYCPTCSKEHDPESLCRQRDSLKLRQQMAIDWGTGKS